VVTHAPVPRGRGRASPIWLGLLGPTQATPKQFDLARPNLVRQFSQIKMADGRHFDNSFISISQPRIIWFRLNLVRRCKFPFRGWTFDKRIEKFSNSRCRTGVILKIVFWLYLGAILVDQCEIWIGSGKNHMPRSRDQNGNFRKIKMVDGRHFENSFISTSQPWIIRFRSHLIHRCKFPFREWAFDNNRNF